MERPEPAVGQVWRSPTDAVFLVIAEVEGMFMLAFVPSGKSVCYVRGDVHDTDTYVGQFDGFRVKEAT